MTQQLHSCDISLLTETLLLTKASTRCNTCTQLLGMG